MAEFEAFVNAHPYFVAAVVIWTLPWKIYALWKAARNSQPYWFIAMLFLNTFAVLEIFYIFRFSEEMRTNTQALEGDWERRKEDDKAAIMSFIRERGRITASEAEGLLGAPEAVISYYLDELESEGRITKRGGIGRQEYYTAK